MSILKVLALGAPVVMVMHEQNLNWTIQFSAGLMQKRKNAARRVMEMFNDELEVTMAVFDSTTFDHIMRNHVNARRTIKSHCGL
ncbi:peroxisomal (S)-2-hydroxy-acid oxidase GLO4-like protein [Tanacetum coccineum]